MRLSNPSGLDHAIQMLAQLSAELGNTMSSGGVIDARDDWLRWYQRADAQLRNLFSDSELATDLYRTQVDVQHLREYALPYVHISHVVEVWQTRLSETSAQLKELQGFVARPGKIIIPDTSAFLEGERLVNANWRQIANARDGETVRLIIPILVIEELDENKRHRSDRVKERARQTLNLLWHLPVSPEGGGVVAPGITAEVRMDDPWHTRRPVNDVEIVDRASYVMELTGRAVTLAAGDYGILIRARAAGLTAVLTPAPTG